MHARLTLIFAIAAAVFPMGAIASEVVVVGVLAKFEEHVFREFRPPTRLFTVDLTIESPSELRGQEIRISSDQPIAAGHVLRIAGTRIQFTADEKYFLHLRAKPGGPVAMYPLVAQALRDLKKVEKEGEQGG